MNTVFPLSSYFAEPVCAVGQGVSGLCCATEGQRWIFSGYSLTGVSKCASIRLSEQQVCVDLLTITVFPQKPSVFELVRKPDFANLPLIVEDFVKDSAGSYTGELTHCT